MTDDFVRLSHDYHCSGQDRSEVHFVQLGDALREIDPEAAAASKCKDLVTSDYVTPLYQLMNAKI